MTDKTTLLAEVANPVEVFTGDQVDAVLAKIAAQVDGLVFDVKTQNGREACAATAYRIARSKTALDDAGKGLVAEWKAKAKEIDQKRKTIRDTLDELKAKVRNPLTVWENAKAEEKRRIAGWIEKIRGLGNVPRNGNGDILLPIVALEKCRDRLETIDIETGFGDATQEARESKALSMTNILAAIGEAQEAEKAARVAAIDAEKRAIAAAAAAAERAEADRAIWEKEEERRKEMRAAEIGREKAEAEAAERRRRSAAEEAKKMAAAREEARRAAEAERLSRVRQEILLALGAEGLLIGDAMNVRDALIAGRIPHVVFNAGDLAVC